VQLLRRSVHSPRGATANSFNYTAFANYGKRWTSSTYNGDKKEDFNSS
jgi:hypothetical protein